MVAGGRTASGFVGTISLAVTGLFADRKSGINSWRERLDRLRVFGDSLSSNYIWGVAARNMVRITSPAQPLFRDSRVGERTCSHKGWRKTGSEGK